MLRWIEVAQLERRVDKTVERVAVVEYALALVELVEACLLVADPLTVCGGPEHHFEEIEVQTEFQHPKSEQQHLVDVVLH